MSLLFADGIDIAIIFKVVMAILALVTVLLNQLMGKKPGTTPGEPKPNSSDSFETEETMPTPGSAGNEVQEFLRRIANQKAGKPTPSGRVAPPPLPPPMPLPASAPPARRVAKQPQRPARPPSIAPRGSVMDALPVAPEESVADHVRRQMNTSSFETRAESLGVKVEQADSQMEAHLKSAFDHKVGTLAGRQISASDSETSTTSAAGIAAEAASPGAALVNLLMDPANRRNVMILNEILPRPEHNW